MRVFVGLLCSAAPRWQCALVTSPHEEHHDNLLVEAPVFFGHGSGLGLVTSKLVPSTSVVALAPVSSFFTEAYSATNLVTEALTPTCSMLYKASVLPSTDVHWLGGLSEVYPTRVSDVASNDPIFLNSKDLKALDRASSLYSIELFD